MPAHPDAILEDTQADFFWVPSDVRVVDRAELAYLACERNMPYLNTVVRTRAASERVPALIAEVVAAHRGVRSRWLVCPQNHHPALLAALSAAGYRSGPAHDGFTLSVPDWQAAQPSVDVQPIRERSSLLAAIAVSDRSFGHSHGVLGPEVLDQQLEQCRGSRVVRVLARDSAGVPAATGGLTMFPALRFGLLWGGCTVPPARGQGIYRAVLAARIEAARAAGLERVGLYARLESSAPIVARLGFQRHGRMTYWERLPAVLRPE